VKGVSLARRIKEVLIKFERNPAAAEAAMISPALADDLKAVLFEERTLSDSL
jgi:hypothetical protein